RHVGERFQALVALVPLLRLATEVEGDVQHFPIVPHYPEWLGHPPEHPAGHPLDDRAIEACELCAWDSAATFGHDSSFSACRHRRGIGRDTSADFFTDSGSRAGSFSHSKHRCPPWSLRLGRGKAP